MSKNLLMGLLSNIRNISISGDTEIYVISDVHTSEDTENITITGLDEELEAVNFNILKSSIANISTFCNDIELHMTDNKLILVSEF
jgi:hypothetical protein